MGMKVDVEVVCLIHRFMASKVSLKDSGASPVGKSSFKYFFRVVCKAQSKMNRVTVRAESISGGVCEICGARGQVQNLGGSLFVQALCMKHKFGY
jgi:hypothetical protein